MEYSRSQYLSLPSKSGVYVFLNDQNAVLYVGKAKDLKSRVSSYFVNPDLLIGKTKILVSQIKKIKITIVESELEALLLEAFYIKKYKPKYNILLKDGKSYILIRITIKDDYPKVLLSRKNDDKNSFYFGPYPSAGAVRLVLKTIRKIFPYQSVLNHPKRVCLYHHLGLCPCPPVFASNELKKGYRKNIRGIIRMLECESQKIMKELEKERDSLSASENYEEALELQKKIKALSIITTPFRQAFEYDVNPNLRSDIRQQEIDQLMDVLNKNSFKLKQLERIECYDISNIQGTNATGSMVVLTNGEIDKSQYRKFKIKKDGKPNDFAMMKEMLKRRFNHDEWSEPDLIVIDGGKGQVSSALDALAQKGRSIPLIGLAKREETIVIPNIPVIASEAKQSQEENFTEVLIPKNTPALQLIMRIRDEAHRFAITYHKKLRSKSTLI
ncbi:GIY-YIG nuclease family protein [Candidatus Roizmanbacteria bacterium]|nr:GIY-YIG nuclease family protein [Candidatus Roizmanbacteria bacterium]